MRRDDARLPLTADPVQRKALHRARHEHREYLKPRLDEALDRLQRLRTRRLDALVNRLAGRDDQRSRQEHARHERETRTLEADHEARVRESMAPADHTVLQVVAVLVGQGCVTRPEHLRSSSPAAQRS